MVQILNPLGMVGDVEHRPALYLPTLTDDELIGYAESYAATALEKEFLIRAKRLTTCVDQCPNCGHIL